MADKSKPKYGYNFARTHKETDFDILTLAVDLKKKVSRYVLTEKYVPKKWRYFDGRDAVIYGSMKWRNARRSVYETVKLYNELFNDHKDLWGRSEHHGRKDHADQVGYQR